MELSPQKLTVGMSSSVGLKLSVYVKAGSENELLENAKINHLELKVSTETLSKG